MVPDEAARGTEWGHRAEVRLNHRQRQPRKVAPVVGRPDRCFAVGVFGLIGSGLPCELENGREHRWMPAHELCCYTGGAGRKRAADELSEHGSPGKVS